LSTGQLNTSPCSARTTQPQLVHCSRRRAMGSPPTPRVLDVVVAALAADRVAGAASLLRVEALGDDRPCAFVARIRGPEPSPRLRAGTLARQPGAADASLWPWLSGPGVSVPKWSRVQRFRRRGRGHDLRPSPPLRTGTRKTPSVKLGEPMNWGHGEWQRWRFRGR
jgi:hypothetical protein